MFKDLNEKYNFPTIIVEPIDERAKYINLGDWIHYNSYAVFDNGKLTIQYFK